MRAIQLVGPRRLTIREVIRPVPSASQVRVSIQGSELSGSNLPVWQGRPWFNYPLEPGAPGHEAWGVVDAVGTEVTNVQPGDRVALLSPSRRSFALETARHCGAEVVLRLGADMGETGRAVNDLSQGRGCERVIEAAGEQHTLDLASELIAVRGRLVIGGYHQDSPRAVNLQLGNWRGIAVVNAHEREPAKYVEGIRGAADMVARGALDSEPLYTHAFDLEHAVDAFAALEARPEKFLKDGYGQNYEDDQRAAFPAEGL